MLVMSRFYIKQFKSLKKSCLSTQTKEFQSIKKNYYLGILNYEKLISQIGKFSTIYLPAFYYLMKSFSLLLLIIVLFSIKSTANSQLPCYYCEEQVTKKYKCNGKQCYAFVWPNTYLPDNLDCKLSSSGQCYYDNGTYPTDQTQTHLFVACNYSMEGCSQCKSKQLCNECYPGYALNRTNLYSWECQLCNFTIPGCIYCENQGKCTQCAEGYVPKDGLCYENDGKTLAGAINYEKQNESSLLALDNTMKSVLQELKSLLWVLIFLLVAVSTGVLTIALIGCKINRKKNGNKSLMGSSNLTE